eukprot:gene24850-31239_t
MLSSLGFVEVNYVAAFGEYEYEFLVADIDHNVEVERVSTEDSEALPRRINSIADVMKRAAHAVYVEYTEP